MSNLDEFFSRYGSPAKDTFVQCFSVRFQHFDIFLHFGDFPHGALIFCRYSAHIVDTVRARVVNIYALVRFFRGASVSAEKFVKIAHFVPSFSSSSTSILNGALPPQIFSHPRRSRSASSFVSYNVPYFFFRFLKLLPVRIFSLPFVSFPSDMPPTVGLF